MTLAVNTDDPRFIAGSYRYMGEQDNKNNSGCLAMLDGEFVIRVIQESTAPIIAISNMARMIKGHPDFPAINRNFVKEVVDGSANTQPASKIHIKIKLDIL